MDQIAKRVPIGSTASQADKALKECGLEYSLDKSNNTFVAIKRDTNNGVIQESRTVVIKLDGPDKVSSVEVKSRFTGP